MHFQEDLAITLINPFFISLLNGSFFKHYKWIVISIGLLTFSKIAAASNQSSGLFSHQKFSEALRVISPFLSPNPTILLIGNHSVIYEECVARWPLATIFTSVEDYECKKCILDFLWINNDLMPLEICEDLLENLRVLYWTRLGFVNFDSSEAKQTYHFHNSQIFSEKSLIEKKKLKLCTHWYGEKGEEGLFFLCENLYDAFVKALHYPSSTDQHLFPHFPEPSLHRFLKKIGTKSANCSLAGIDCIYLINLDERPEKLSLTLSALQPYGIYPFRTAAINGWNLSIETLNQIGVRYSNGMLRDHCLGLVFREIADREYRNFELIANEGTTYFTPGISRGAIGILLSHLSILQDSYDTNYQTIWVMEDDIQILEDPRHLIPLIQELNHLDPHWDILFTDVDSKDAKGNYVPCRAFAMRPDVAIPPLSSFLKKSYRVNDHFSRVGMRYGAYSMILRRSGVEKILNYYKKHAIFLPYDADYWLIPSLKMYCVNRDIVSTIPGAISDNSYPRYLENQTK